MPYPVATVAKNATGYVSPTDAACAALNSVGDIKSSDDEHAGVVLKGPDGKYYHTGMMPAQEEHFGLTVQAGKGWSLAGIYHTHPYHDEMSQYFSPNDIDVANQLNVPSFIRFGQENAIRQFIPKKTPTFNASDDGDLAGAVNVSRGAHVDCPVPQVAPSSPVLMAANASAPSIPTNNISPVSPAASR